MTISTTSSTDSRDGGTVRVESVYATGIDDLWDACTSPERLARWIATVNGDLRVGGVVQLCYTSSWAGQARIEVCDPPHHVLLVDEPDTPQQGETELWLVPETDHTRLIVEERGLDPEELRFHQAGWRAHLEDLDSYLTTGAQLHAEGWSSQQPASDWHRRFTEYAKAD